MARQTGPNPFIGRRGNLLGYRMAGKYYARIVSGLSAERVLKDPAFQLTMQYAGLLGKASKIASSIYRLLPQKEHGFYRRLTGMAMQMLKQGKTADEAFEQLNSDFIVPALSMEVPKPERVSNTQFRANIFYAQVDVPSKKRVPNSKKISGYKRQLAEAPQKNRVFNSSFPDELLRRLFSKPPAERDSFRAKAADRIRQRCPDGLGTYGNQGNHQRQ